MYPYSLQWASFINVETSTDPRAQINLRQGSLLETFVSHQFHRTNDRTLINVVAENNRVSITPLKTPWFRSLTPRVYNIESSHLYLYIALYKTDCVKAALDCRTAHFCNVMFCIVILLLKYYKHFLKKGV